jgi:hypothetical protein
MTRYPNISDHGLIGDLQTAALVTTDGAVNWFCCRALTRRASSGRCWMRITGATSGSPRTGMTT